MESRSNSATTAHQQKKVGSGYTGAMIHSAVEGKGGLSSHSTVTGKRDMKTHSVAVEVSGWKHTGPS